MIAAARRGLARVNAAARSVVRSSRSHVMTPPPRRSARLAAAAGSAAASQQPITQAAVQSVDRAKRKRKPAVQNDGVSQSGRRRKSAPRTVAGTEEEEEQQAAVAQSTSTAAPAAKKRAGSKAGPTKELEMKLWAQGYRLVAGTDEAGRGPLAGPVVAAACCIPEDVVIEGVADSKKLTEAQREAIYEALTGNPRIAWAACVVDARTIDDINILQAAMLAMETAVDKVPSRPDYVLVDGNRLPKGLPEERAQAVIKGDDTCYCIAAASVIAKVTRDRIMLEYDLLWPQYDLKNNKGYGTAKHMAAIREHGAMPIHRRTFAPLKHMDLPPHES